MKTFLTFGMCLLIFFSLATQGFAIGQPFTSGGDCTASLINHSAYTDTSGWQFQGNCTSPVALSYKVSAMWNGAERKALESLEGGNNLQGSLISICPADPWLNEVMCALVAIQGDIFNYYKVPIFMRYPLTGGALSAQQKAQYNAEAQANGPKPSSQAPPPPPPPAKDMRKLAPELTSQTPESSKLKAIAPKLAVPIILLPTQGQEFSSSGPIKIQVKPPVLTTETKVKLYFEWKHGQNWEEKNVIPDYDVKANPNGINVDYSKFKKKGNWRMKARMATPDTAKWTNLVEFKIN